MDPRILRQSTRLFALTISLCALAGTKHNFDLPVFVYSYHPDLPISRYAAGDLGIPEPHHARIYLFAAYRYFEGRPLSPEEQKLWLHQWEHRLNRTWPDRVDTSAWDSIRSKVPLPFAPTQPGVVATRGFTFNSPCAEDAYTTAAATLAARIRRFGISSPEVRAWAQGQDAVFETCKTSAPQQFSPLPAAMPELIRADRAYQQAAALFYAQHFDEARAAFDRIAMDTASPWRIWAPYLAGRSLLWKARQTQSDTVYYESLRQAEKQFNAVLANPALAATHLAAENLLLRCMLITNRKVAIERLGRKLDRGAWLESDLYLYLNALDSMFNHPYEDRATPPRADWPADPLSQWILAFQNDRTPDAALARWRATQSPAWLYAALWRANSATPADLAAAAFALPLTRPGAPALHFAASRLLAWRAEFDLARGALDAVLAALKDFPSASNRTLQLRSQLASDLASFVSLLPRSVIFASIELDTNQVASQEHHDLTWVRNPTKQQIQYARESGARATRLKSLPRLDEFGAAILNTRLPLRLLASIAAGNQLPPHLRQELVLATWTRSVLLNRWDVALQLGPAVAASQPAVQAEMTAFLARPSEEAAAFVFRKLPGARPFMSRGYGRQLTPDKHDEWARNWWYRLTENEMHVIEVELPFMRGGRRDQPPPRLLPHLSFVTETDAAEASAEWAQLRKSGERGLDWIARRVVASLDRTPARADAPEILFQLLVSSRHSWWAAPPDYDQPQTGLRAAYRLLSTRYPRSPWFARLDEIEHGGSLPSWK